MSKQNKALIAVTVIAFIALSSALVLWGFNMILQGSAVCAAAFITVVAILGVYKPDRALTVDRVSRNRIAISAALVLLGILGIVYSLFLGDSNVLAQILLELSPPLLAVGLLVPVFFAIFPKIMGKEKITR